MHSHNKDKWWAQVHRVDQHCRSSSKSWKVAKVGFSFLGCDIWTIEDRKGSDQRSNNTYYILNVTQSASKTKQVLYSLIVHCDGDGQTLRSSEWCSTHIFAWVHSVVRCVSDECIKWDRKTNFVYFLLPVIAVHDFHLIRVHFPFVISFIRFPFQYNLEIHASEMMYI